MRFNLIDQITEVEPGRSLQAVKLLTLAEEYLADHFPTFPVMPGVLQLHALVEAASWLVRLSDDFASSVTVLRDVKSVKYNSFVAPGHALRLTVELARREGETASFKGKGEVNGVTTVSAQFTVASYNLADRDPIHGRDKDERLTQHWRERAAMLRGRR